MNEEVSCTTSECKHYFCEFNWLDGIKYFITPYKRKAYLRIAEIKQNSHKKSLNITTLAHWYLHGFIDSPALKKTV